MFLSGLIFKGDPNYEFNEMDKKLHSDSGLTTDAKTSSVATEMNEFSQKNPLNGDSDETAINDGKSNYQTVIIMNAI